MADNMVLTGKIGETGKTWTVALRSTNASGVMAAHDLTGYTEMKLQVEDARGNVIMDQVECSVTDAEEGTITCTTDLTTDEHAGLIAGTFRAEFSGLNGAGKKRYWPINAQSERTYGKMIIQDPLA